jgi:hypothetical protein
MSSKTPAKKPKKNPAPQPSVTKGTGGRGLSIRNPRVYAPVTAGTAVGITALILLYIFVWAPHAWTPTINGVMTSGEWNGAKYKAIPFWLDVNNDPDPETGVRNIDGWNYLYLGQDSNNYYLGLDLCSQRISNVTNETLSTYIASGPLPQVRASTLGFHAMRGHGLEFINFNSSTNSSIPRNIGYSSMATVHDIPYVPGPDSYAVRWGNTTGNYTDIWRDDLENLTLSSISGDEYDAGPSYSNANFAMIDFVFNITDKFPLGFESDFLGNLTNLYLDASISATLGADGTNEGTNHTNIFAAVLSDPDPSKIDALHDSATYTALNYAHQISFNPNVIAMDSVNVPIANLAANKLWHVSLFFWNENGTNTNFTVSLDRLSIGVRTTGYDGYADTSLPTTSYDVNYSRGSSDNQAALHRMYEIRISKARLSDTRLSIYIVGTFGTQSFAPSGIGMWFYPSSLLPILVGILSGVTFPTFDAGFASFPL